MTTYFFSHVSSLEHLAPKGHPDQPERLQRVIKVASRLDGLALRTPPKATKADILTAHTEKYFELVEDEIPQQAGEIVQLSTGDVMLCPQSLEAAFYAVGGICAAVDSVMQGLAHNAFVASRSCGHHALPYKGMGFCIFAMSAIGVRRALDFWHAQRVAVVDFDIHHGNGTEACLWEEERALHISLHQGQKFDDGGFRGLYPQSEKHRGDPGSIPRDRRHRLVNIPLKPGTTSAQFRQAFETQVFPNLEKFAPDLILVEAGFDGDARNPRDMGTRWELGPDDYAWVMRSLQNIANQTCDGRLVANLAGGYNPDAVAEDAEVCLTAMIKYKPIALPHAFIP